MSGVRCSRGSDGFGFLLPDGRGGRLVILDGDKMLKARRTTKDRAGGNGFGVSAENCCYTLNTVDRHGVAVFRGCV